MIGLLLFYISLHPVGGGGHSGTKCPLTNRLAEFVEVQGRSTRLRAKKEGSQLQSKNIMKGVTCKMRLVSLYFVKYMIFIICNASWKN